MMRKRIEQSLTMLSAFIIGTLCLIFMYAVYSETYMILPYVFSYLVFIIILCVLVFFACVIGYGVILVLKFIVLLVNTNGVNTND